MRPRRRGGTSKAHPGVPRASGDSQRVSGQDRVVDGKTVVITGANSGIGYAAAEVLAQRGANLILLCRNDARAETAKRSIAEVAPKATIDCYPLDLASFASVRKAAASVLEHHPRIDVLINNAGLFLPSRTLTEDDLEATLQINHFGPFLLTHLLVPRLFESAPSRIVNVSSRAHRMGTMKFDGFRYDEKYSAWEAYGTSKLMNIYHARSLANRLDPSKVTANALHPGVVSTEFAQDEMSMVGRALKLLGFLLKTPRQGAATTIHLASHPEGGLKTGQYFQDEKPAQPRAFALNDEAAERLWHESERVTGARWSLG